MIFQTETVNISTTTFTFLVIKVTSPLRVCSETLVEALKLFTFCVYQSLTLSGQSWWDLSSDFSRRNEVIGLRNATVRCAVMVLQFPVIHQG